MLRQPLSIAHIIAGRHLVKSVKRICKKCRIINKKSIAVIMGPIRNVNLCIAPAFYASQIDIFGPYKSFSNANKRATIKFWFLILCCCSTGAVDIRLMEDYSTDLICFVIYKIFVPLWLPEILASRSWEQISKEM